MKEQQVGSEVLSEAAREVSGLFMGDNLARMLGTQSVEQREKFWTESAQKYSAFSEQIKGLRQTVQVADATKKQYPSPVIAVLGMNFSNIEDVGARMLLTDILVARVIKSPGYMDYSMKIAEEADAIKKELSAKKGVEEGNLTNITLKNVVESVLIGDLKLSRQTQLRKK